MTALSLVAGLTIAGEPGRSPTKPIGTWKRSVENGSWSITVENSRLVFTAHGPGERVTTLTAPRYEISEEGVVFGYVAEVVSTLGKEETRFKGKVHPFAFRLKVNGETLTVSDFNMHGLNPGVPETVPGDYKKEATETASKPQSDVKR